MWSPFVVAILRLSPKGATFLQGEKKIPLQPSIPVLQRTQLSETIRIHEINIRDIRAAFIGNIRTEPALILQEFQMLRPMTAFSVFCVDHWKMETVRPDAFMVVKESRGSSRDQGFFLEIDRSTESQSHLLHLAKLYMEYFRTGGFARKRGKTPLDRSDCPVRVLIIFDSRKRMANAARKFLKGTRVKTLIWLAAKEDVMRDPLGAIWNCPEDFGPGKERTEKRRLFRESRE